MDQLRKLGTHVPDKLLTDRTKGWLWEKGGAELVRLYQVNFSLFYRTTSLTKIEQRISLSLSFHLLAVTCSIWNKVNRVNSPSLKPG